MKESTLTNYLGCGICHNAFGEFNICKYDNGLLVMLTPTREYSFRSLQEAKEKIKEIVNKKCQ